MFLRLGVMVVAFSTVGLAQGAAPQKLTPQQSTVLTVSGRAGQAPVIRRNGRSYVDVEALARVTGATLGFEGSSILLILPTSTAAPVVVEPPQTPVPVKLEEKGYSREFLQAGVEQMTVIREWRSAIENAIRTNNPVEESWISYYRRTSQDKMAMATASATTDTDRQALPLLQGAMGMVGQLSDRFLHCGRR